jgi:hypothetical protein
MACISRCGYAPANVSYTYCAARPPAPISPRFLFSVEKSPAMIYSTLGDSASATVPPLGAAVSSEPGVQLFTSKSGLVTARGLIRIF